MSEPKVEDTEEVIEEIGVEDGSDPSYQLDPALAAKLLSGGSGQGSLISALQGHLEGMIGKPSGLIESLPKTLRNRLAYLGELQDQHDELAEKLHEEQVALQRKYEKLWDPLFQKRAAIVQGKEEAPDALHSGEEDEIKEAEPESDVSGIPDFWMHVLQSHKGWNEEIQDKDIPILSHLVDIRTVNLRDEEDVSTSNNDAEDDEEDDDEDVGPKGFKIIFEFSDNPFFSNKELVKTYYMVSDDASDPVLQKATATTIQWASGKNPGVKLQKKKAPKGKSRPPVRSTRVPTFFDFFSPPTVPETESELTEEGMDELQSALEKDYELGELLRDDIIPYAIKWFTGEAQMEDSDEEDDLDEEDEEDDEDIAQLVQSAADEDDEDDEEEDESPAKPSQGRGGKKGKPAAARGGADKETPPDCKQQ